MNNVKQTAVRDFEADRKICDAATAGPWSTFDSMWVIDSSTDSADVLVAECKRNYDARFIAEARTGWPAALDEIERLKKLLHAIMTDKHAAVTMDDLRTENECYRQALESVDRITKSYVSNEVAYRVRKIVRRALVDG